MNRGRRAKNNGMVSSKYMIYISLVVLIGMIATFFVTLFIYNKKMKNNQFSELTAEKIAELVPNENNSELEQASIDIGKSIEEVVKQVEESVEEKNVDEKQENIQEGAQEENIKVTNIEPQEDPEPVVIKDPEFSMPLEGEISKNYAKDSLIYSETLQEWVTHLGIDIKAPRTTIVKAAESGKVASIKNDPRYGLTIVIEHTNGYESVYSNLLTTEFVSEGETVEKGQTIGTVGNSASFEIVDEPHLHFEILKDGESVDPNIYLK